LDWVVAVVVHALPRIHTSWGWAKQQIMSVNWAYRGKIEQANRKDIITIRFQKKSAPKIS
jgi:hypothetical protein